MSQTWQEETDMAATSKKRARPAIVNDSGKINHRFYLQTGKVLMWITSIDEIFLCLLQLKQKGTYNPEILNLRTRTFFLDTKQPIVSWLTWSIEKQLDDETIDLGQALINAGCDLSQLGYNPA